MTSRPAGAGSGGPGLEGFRALRYAPHLDLETVTMTPPALWDYAALADTARRDDRHVLRLLAPGLVGAGSALATAVSWVGDGTLLADSEPRLWSWQWTEHGSHVVGVAGALRLPAPDVAPHERVRDDLVADRGRELGSGRVQPEPIVLLHDGEPLLPPGRPDRAPRPPGVDLDTPSGRHRLAPVSGPRARARLDTALAGERLVLADGHHRFRVLSGLPAPRPRAFVLVVDVPRSGLSVGPIPRVLPGLSWDVVAATPGARLAPLGDQGRQAFLDEAPPGRLRWVLADGSRVRGLELDADAAERVDRADPCGPVARDVCHLHRHLLPAWGVPAGTVRYAHSWAAARRLAGRDAGLAVEARPPTLAEVMAAARAGTLLPHKATSISPKPRTGLLMLDDAGAAG